METVAILGASNRPERFAYRAQQQLLEKGYQPVPINPGYGEIEGVTCYPALQHCPQDISVITVYLRPDRLGPLVDEMIAANPRKVIFNPGSENRQVMVQLQQAGVEVEAACTLIMLDSGRL